MLQILKGLGGFLLPGLRVADDVIHMALPCSKESFLGPSGGPIDMLAAAESVVIVEDRQNTVGGCALFPNSSHDVFTDIAGVHEDQEFPVFRISDIQQLDLIVIPEFDNSLDL